MDSKHQLLLSSSELMFDEGTSEALQHHGQDSPGSIFFLLGEILKASSFFTAANRKEKPVSQCVPLPVNMFLTSDLTCQRGKEEEQQHKPP